jgi:hypothetical protein
MVPLFVTLTPMNCPNCGDTLAERGAYCKACGAQARCMACKAALESGAAACVECGTKLGVAVANGHPVATSPEPRRNKITFREDRNSRSIDADFSDHTMQALGGILGDIFSARTAVSVQRQANTRTFSQELESAPEKTLPPPEVPTVVDGANPDLQNIAKIFRKKGDGLELIDNQLKAKSGMDFVRRLTYVFLYAHELHARTSVSKASVIAILKDGKVWDGNSSKWLSKRERLRPTQAGDEEEHLELIATSREEAKKVLADFLNDSIKDEWNPDTKVKQKRAKKKKA